jgi:hypothetical protein
VMVKPPGDPGRRRILEVDDRVLVSVKILFIEQRTGAMDQAGELEIDAGTDAFAVKAGKQRRRSSAVKTFAVKEDPYFQKTCPCSLRFGILVKLLEMTLLSRNVKKLTSSPLTMLLLQLRRNAARSGKQAAGAPPNYL